MPTQFRSLSFVAVVIIAAVVILASSPSSSSPVSPAEASECEIALYVLSPCAPYLAAPPNGVSTRPSLTCCEAFTQAIVTAGPPCVCYMLRDPLILGAGAPIDPGKLVAMFPSCRVNDTGSASRWLHDTCQSQGDVSSGRGQLLWQGVWLILILSSFLEFYILI
ncbi:putative lipid transfer [Carex littledalei]|uniref:Putative lipid transfer n=1 Tax=Carex littledalei TaxID=544730 RepID=A0A833RPQ7_9POAL|nr:putative lipid transfer [Carex littledalei]